MDWRRIKGWHIAGAVYSIAVLAPLALLGPNENGILTAFSVALGIPFLIFTVVYTVYMLHQALYPTAILIVNLFFFKQKTAYEIVNYITARRKGR